jgi:Ca-activated chloride channel family protein
MNLGPASDRNLHSTLSVQILIFAAFFWLALSPFPARAQTDATADVHITPSPSAPKSPQSRGSETVADKIPGPGHPKPLVANVDLVLVPVTVTDSRNRAVTGLRKENFELYEDNRRQLIHNFYSEDVPLSLGVILDTSKSMSNKMELARQSVVDFFKTANPEDDFFIITFSDRPLLLADFTTSLEHIQNQLVYAVPHGHTSLLDAIYMGLTKIRRSRYERRALLIISDGGDNCSRYTPTEIKRIVEEADVELYGIGIFDEVFKTPEERAGEQLLDAITEATGGRTFAIKDSKDLSHAASAIALELRNQYIVGYRSNNHARDGKWRRIKVKIVPPPEMPPLHVYSKSGYYSPEE